MSATKVTRNPNEMIGSSNLKPGRHARRSAKPEPAMKMLSTRVPTETADALDEILATINADRKRISKQDYLAKIIQDAVKADGEKLEAGKELDY